MSESPLVTYLLILYNQEQYAAEAVRSALAQTYIPLEIVISDDGSTDGTWATIESAVRDYRGPHKIILNRNDPNVGIGEHFNRIVPLGSGEWCVVAAGDDVSDPRRVETLIRASDQYTSAKAVFSKWRRIDDQGNVLAPSDPVHFRSETAEIFDMRRWLQLSLTYGYLPFAGCAAMWHRSLFSGFPPLESTVMSEDVVLGFRALMSGSILIINDTLVSYRVHAGNISGAASHSGMQRVMHHSRSVARSISSFEVNLKELGECTHVKEFNAGNVQAFLRATIEKMKIDASWWAAGIVAKVRYLNRIRSITNMTTAMRYVPRLLPLRVYLLYLRWLRFKRY